MLQNIQNRTVLFVLVLAIWGVAFYSRPHLKDWPQHQKQAEITNLLGNRLSNLPLPRAIYDKRRQLMFMHNKRFNQSRNLAITGEEAPVYVVCGEDGDWIDLNWVSEDCVTSSPQCDLLRSPDWSSNEQPPRLVFLGDSTMKYLAETFKTFFPKGSVTKRSDNCHTIEEMLMMERAAYWSPPTSTEGPLKNGLENNFCSDCSGCMGFLYESQYMDIQYIPVEFARDVELQSSDTRTTQETVVKYLKATSRETILFVNTGLHDCAILDCNFTVYEHNLKWYMQLLVDIKHITVVWIQTNAVQGMLAFPQKNDRIERMNQIAVGVCDDVGVVSIVNTFDMSKHEWALQNLFVDNVHLLKERRLYYRTVGNIIGTHIVCPIFS